MRTPAPKGAQAPPKGDRSGALPRLPSASLEQGECGLDLSQRVGPMTVVGPFVGTHLKKPEELALFGMRTHRGLAVGHLNRLVAIRTEDLPDHLFDRQLGEVQWCCRRRLGPGGRCG